MRQRQRIKVEILKHKKRNRKFNQATCLFAQTLYVNNEWFKYIQTHTHNILFTNSNNEEKNAESGLTTGTFPHI